MHREGKQHGRHTREMRVFCNRHECLLAQVSAFFFFLFPDHKCKFLCEAFAVTLIWLLNRSVQNIEQELKMLRLGGRGGGVGLVEHIFLVAEQTSRFDLRLSIMSL